MKICVPVLTKNTSEAIKKIETAQERNDVDLLEIWCGEIVDLNLQKIFAIKQKPFVLNCKGLSEKGTFTGTEREKLDILLKGASLGAEYCDFSLDTPQEILTQFSRNKAKTNLIISTHYWKNTPTLPALLNTAQKMRSLGADIIKIATLTKDTKDLLTLLRFAENLQRKKTRHISIAMGSLGSISRFLIPELFGGEFTFAPLEKESSNAPGQLSLDKLRELENIFK